MSVLRNVLHDLVEKKLWPIAILLVVALVAIPTVFGGDEAAPVAAAPAGPADAAAPPPAARASVVAVDEQTAAEPVQRKGKVRNPFVQHHVPKEPNLAAQAESILTSTQALVPASTSGSSTTDDTSSTPTATSTPATGGGTGGGTGATTKGEDKPKADPEDVYDVQLSFGEAGGQRKYKNIARLTPMPSSTDAFVVFLGVKSDGKTAMFLVSSDAAPTGDGKCRPSADSCETLELKAGQTEFLDLQTGTAGVVQYQLDVEKITKRKAGSKATAAAARARESKAGREVLRAAVASDPDLLDGWEFSRSLGVLVATDDAEADSADVAHLPAGVADAADGDEASTAPQLGEPATP